MDPKFTKEEENVYRGRRVQMTPIENPYRRKAIVATGSWTRKKEARRTKKENPAREK